MMVENLEPWGDGNWIGGNIHSGKKGKLVNQQSQDGGYYKDGAVICKNCKFNCQCMDLSDSPTEAGENYHNFNSLCQDVEIDEPTNNKPP